jgi:hypothetical protein
MITNQQLLKMIEEHKALLIAVATGGPRIQNKETEYRERRAVIKLELRARQLDDPNPHADLWAWYGRWSNGDLPSYQSRRRYINDMYKPLVDRLESGFDDNPSKPIVEATGWPKVDRDVDGIRTDLEEAKHEVDYQAVGLRCRETLISLAQAVYDPNLHKTSDGKSPSSTDAYRMLEAYFGAQLAGSSQEALRGHAKASLKLANDLQHRRTATFRDAALCAEASRTVVNIIAIISGKRDPQEETKPAEEVKPAPEDSEFPF